MPDKMNYLNTTMDAFADVANKSSEIANIIKKGDEQADTRRGAIQTINEMCDALQLACDLISRELSSSIIEFSQVRNGTEVDLRGFFERAAIKVSQSSLRVLLHDGKVCGELHALYDRFTQPFSNVTTGGVPFWENVKTFFARSNAMSMALSGLHAGEMTYLQDFGSFLNEIRDSAEKALLIPWENISEVQQAGEQLIILMRQKRQDMQDQVLAMRNNANACIKKLH